MPATTKKAVALDHLQSLATRTEECIADVAGTAAAAIQEIAGMIPGTMTGASAQAAGTSGTAPAPAAGKQSAFLRGDGTWADPIIVSSSTPSNTNAIWFKTSAQNAQNV